MLSLALSTIFLISLVSASEERTAAVLSASTSHSLALTSRGVKVFNAKAALAEKDQIAAQYSSKRAPHEDRKKNDRMGHPSQHKHFEEEYDIRKKCKPHHGPHGDKMCSHGKGGHHKRSFGESSGKEDSGAEPMVDVFDTADECKCAHEVQKIDCLLIGSHVDHSVLRQPRQCVFYLWHSNDG